MSWTLAPLLLAAACQGQGSGDKAPKKEPTGSAAPTTPEPAPGPATAGPANGSSAEGSGSAVAAGSDDADPPAGAAATQPPSATQLIAKLGAMPVWEGVVQRGQLLARRGERGVLYGRVGPAVGEGSLIWLIDDTEGEGSLAARVAFPGAPPPEGTRIAAAGAWALPPRSVEVPPAVATPPAAAGARPAAAPVAPPAAPRPTPRWYWQVEQSTALPEAAIARKDPAAPAAPAAVIGHEPIIAPRPAGAVPISKAKDNDLVYFQVLSAPRRLGEAWLVGDQLGSPPIAMLALPGDRPSYGGIDFRQPDEQWRLRRGVTYVVRIGKIRRKDPAKPATINARNAPIKIS